MDVRVVLQLPAPRMQDTSETREVCPDEPLVFGEPFERLRRGGAQGVVREALMRADAGSECLRHGEGTEEVRPGQRCVQVVREPLLGLRLRPLGTVAVATGMMDAVVPPTAWALLEARAVMAAVALWDSADALSVCGGERGRALQGFRGKGGQEIAEGAHGRSPRMRALRRSEASSCP